jgi:hypothetical protein
MVSNDCVAVRMSGPARHHSLAETSKPAASAFGGPFPHTPAVLVVVAGIGYFAILTD